MKQFKVLTAVLFCGFLGIMGLLYMVLPEKEFSDREKRYLQEKPSFTWEKVSSGEWGEETEAYLADHMPGRDFFVGLNAYSDLLTGRQKTKDIWVSGDRLLEAPAKAEPEEAGKKAGILKTFAEKQKIPVDLMLVPSAGAYAEPEDYEDQKLLEGLSGELKDAIHVVDLYPHLTAEDFYRTDHHWKSSGAWKTAEVYLRDLGRWEDLEFEKEVSENFRGSTYARSGLWLTAPEALEIWTGSEELTVDTGEETVHEGIFYRENLKGFDPYAVFLGGNHPMVTIRNPHREGKLLVIRDSFASCLGGFLAESFGEVTLVDLRYYKQPISLLLQQGSYDRILICYGLKNFLTDRNLPFLTR